MKNKCRKCDKNATFKVEPSRHSMSPNSINYGWNPSRRPKYYDYYCSKECQKADQDLTYTCLAEIDRNASDSACFQHERWDGKYRVGVCKITGEKVRVEPLMHGDNSGQPVSCYKHFELHPRYKKILENNNLPEIHYV